MMSEKDLEARMTFFGHLAELRKRILLSVVGVVVGFAIAYAFAKTLFRWLRVPYDSAYVSVYGVEPTLQGISLLEGFMTYLRIGFLGGIFISSPWIFYQLWKFISPALRHSEKKHVIPFVTFATLFFVGGAVFGYWVVFPKSFEFLLSITKGELIAQNIRMQEYYKFAAMLLIGFGVAFEAPLIVMYLVYFEILDSKVLMDNWRPVVVIILMLSALLTPADIASMLLMAGPLLFLYGLTILMALLFFKKKKRPA